ncbi:hypothetical protein JW848_11080 [Candidatus Bipolaricaulota bacterium]|nr:hypothetical protein [Candidatus Bipolaricaulota bacterium]
MRDEAWGHLGPIHALCEAHKHIPLVTELAIIADRRLIGEKEQPYFVSFISVFVPEAADVAKSYTDAMKYMSFPESGSEPIIPHPALYEPENAMIVVELGDVDGTGLDVSSVNGKPLRWPVYRYGFKLMESPRLEVAGQVERFANRFVSGLGSTADRLPVRRLFEGATLLLLPFVRPHYQPATGRSEDETEAKDIGVGRPKSSPGGAIFLFLVPREGCSDLRELARDLSWLLAAGSVNESYSSIDVAFRRQQLIGKLIHGTTNAIRSVNSNELAQLMCREGRVPPEGPQDLRVRVRAADGEEDRTRLAGIAIAIARAMMGEDTAAALLAFTERNFSRGSLREKFQNKERIRLDDLIDEALILADNWSHAPTGNHAPLKLTKTSHKPAYHPEGRWVIPVGYLDYRMIRGIVAELLINASLHGERDVDGRVTVTCSVLESEDGGVMCQLSNKTRQKIARSQALDYTSGFLQRTSEALAEMDGMRLTFEADEEQGTFHSRLWLGRLEAEKGKDKQSTRLVGPEWEPDGPEVT